jgi:hypothetical protein
MAKGTGTVDHDNLLSGVLYLGYKAQRNLLIKSIFNRFVGYNAATEFDYEHTNTSTLQS